MAAIYSNGGNRWNILGFNFTKRDALSSVYKISMVLTHNSVNCIYISPTELCSSVEQRCWQPNPPPHKKKGVRPRQMDFVAQLPTALHRNRMAVSPIPARGPIVAFFATAPC